MLLIKYASEDSVVDSLYRDLSKILEDAILGKIDGPLDGNDIPGSNSFIEGRFRKYSDLEEAYASFRVELKGGESLALKRLRQKKSLVKRG